MTPTTSRTPELPPRRLTRRSFGLLGAAAVGSAALPQLGAAPAQAATEQLRVVTFNIKDSLTYTQYRDDLEKAVSAGSILCLQEMARRHDDLDRFGENQGWHVRYQSSNAVLINANRFEREAEGAIIISDDVDTNLPRRNLTWMRVRDRRTDRVITAISTHTWSQIESDGRPRADREDRVRGTTVLLKRLNSLVAEAAERGEVVVGGDFNVNWSRDKEVADDRFPWALLERRRNSSVRQLRSHYTGAAGEATHDNTEGNPSRRIDYVYHWRRLEGSRVLRPVGARTISGHSDHRGVSATFDLDVR